MSPSIEILLSCLPEYQDKWIVVSKKQSVKDIISEILEAHKEFAGYYDCIAPYFDADTIEEVCKNIYRFLKDNIRYEEEKEADQTTALPAGLLTRRKGDCKHYASFAGGVLDALNRAGDSIEWNYRFASYNLLDNTPHHVFVVAKDENGSECWIDPTPGSRDHVPVWAVDKKIKISAMPLRRNIAGFNMGRTADSVIYVDALPANPSEVLSPASVVALEEEQAEVEVTPELQEAIEILMHYGILNEMGEVSDKVLLALSSVLPQDEFDLVSNARQVLQVYIHKGAMMGSIFSDIWRGVKKVSLAVPRNAYLGLVALNVFGYATKLSNSIYNTDGSYFQPNQDDLYKKWHSLGGDWHNLQIAIDSGKKKGAILGSLDIEDPSQIFESADLYRKVISLSPSSMGVAAAAVAAWAAAASAIIAALTPLIKAMIARKQQAGALPSTIDPTTGLPYNMNTPGALPAAGSGNIMDKIMNFVKANPIEAIGLAAGGYLLLTGKSSKRGAA